MPNKEQPPKKMQAPKNDQSEKHHQSNSSKNVAIATVGLLVLVAIVIYFFN